MLCYIHFWGSKRRQSLVAIAVREKCLRVIFRRGVCISTICTYAQLVSQLVVVIFLSFIIFKIFFIIFGIKHDAQFISDNPTLLNWRCQDFVL